MLTFLPKILTFFTFFDYVKFCRGPQFAILLRTSGAADGRQKDGRKHSKSVKGHWEPGALKAHRKGKQKRDGRESFDRESPLSSVRWVNSSAF